MPLYGTKYTYQIFKQIYGTLTDTTTLDQSGSGSNGNERVLHTPLSSKTRASSWDEV